MAEIRGSDLVPGCAGDTEGAFPACLHKEKNISCKTYAARMILGYITLREFADTNTTDGTVS